MKYVNGRINGVVTFCVEIAFNNRLEVTERRGRRHRKLLDDLKERRVYLHLKKEALDRTKWRARFGTGFGPVARQTANE
jgi:hypothetical protein